MRNSYDPKAVESGWYEWWVKQGFFTADNTSNKETFVIVIPPPNVTGSLHLGHALTNSIEDAITRWHRMNGKNTLWVPGTDHAGIATQVVVEKKLMKEKGVSRHDLGREKFISEVWKWKGEYGGRIVNQLKRLGVSVDWSREAFTMDEARSKAVTEAFVRLYDQGLIYRDSRLVNWCCKLNTAISDIEVEHKGIEQPTKMKVPGHGDKEYEFGLLWKFAYPIDGTNEELIVATTRPETMLGDTAIAVHPDDTRYKHLLEKKAFAKHPFLDRKIPIIGDKVLVNMEFGTGAVKVTPAHDPNDYDCGKRNSLEFISILNDDGTLNENAGSFKGLKRFDAREEVIKKLKEANLFRGTENNPMTIAVCSRSKDIIEPRIKPQWWVNCKSMADAAVKAAKSGELEILPSNHRDTWYRWLENIHDWCISRQLWWGHRCPAYLVCIEGEAEQWNLQSHWVVARSEQDALKMAYEKFPKVQQSKISLKQDPDVLDTWFSSGIFPFSVMGWPNETKDMQTFYPTSLLETGHDILFFWVARMVMMGMQLTGKLPFKQVYLHAMVRDAHGRKMSKSLGNVLDPLDMINGVTLEGLHSRLLEGNLDANEVEKAKSGQKQDFPEGIPECGTDAMRFALCAYTSQGRDINLDVKRVAAYRNFCNKLWNVIKFAMMNLGTDFKPADTESYNKDNLSNTELWILSRLENTVKLANDGFKDYDFSQVTSSIYSFWLYELCDVYLESMKPVMNSTNEAKKASCRETLYTCLDNGLRLLHPFMPFVTEELWQRLPRRKTDTTPSICIAAYPKSIPERSNPQAENGLKFVNDIIHAVRSLRASFNLTAEKPVLYINFHNQDQFKEINTPDYTETIAFLSKSSQVNMVLNQSTTPEGCATEIVNETCEVYMLIKGLVDIAVEIKKLEQKKVKLQSDYDRIFKQTQSPNYHKVPESVKTDNTSKMETIQQEIKLTDKAVESYKKFS